MRALSIYPSVNTGPASCDMRARHHVGGVMFDGVFRDHNDEVSVLVVCVGYSLN
jgi:hypothetical protein